MKGISVIVASVLVLVIVVSAVVLVSGWSQSLIKSTTGQVGNKTSDVTTCSSADIIVESVYVTSGNVSPATAQVRNQGYQTITLVSANIINKTGGNFSTTSTLSGLARGQFVQLSFSGVSIGSCPSDFSRLIITTNCGGVAHVFSDTPNCY